MQYLTLIDQYSYDFYMLSSSLVNILSIILPLHVKQTFSIIRTKFGAIAKNGMG